MSDDLRPDGVAKLPRFDGVMRAGDDEVVGAAGLIDREISKERALRSAQAVSVEAKLLFVGSADAPGAGAAIAEAESHGIVCVAGHDPCGGFDLPPAAAQLDQLAIVDVQLLGGAR